MTTWLWIEAVDVWMFRDNKLFNAGQNFFARSQFPPTPRTIQGIIRTAYLEWKGVNWKTFNTGGERRELYDAVGDARSLGRLRLRGPFLARKVNDKPETLHQPPFDLLYREAKDGQPRGYVALAPAKERSFITELPFEDWRPVIRPDHASAHDPQRAGFKEIEARWLTNEQLRAYLAGKIAQIPGDPIEQKDLFLDEERPGLALDRRHRAANQRESRFYRARFIRPCENVGLLVGVDGVDDFPQSRQLRVGGEGKLARIERVQVDLPASPTPQGQVKIVLLTPAYFDDGWRPKNGDWSPWVGKNARLISFIAGKPLALSGWDLAENRPRPLRNFVPAGSVYYFENATLTGQPFTQTPDGEADFGAMGFGTFAPGQWNYLT
jgi:CRISPR-associated protein Cmr3